MSRSLSTRGHIVQRLLKRQVNPQTTTFVVLLLFAFAPFRPVPVISSWSGEITLLSSPRSLVMSRTDQKLVSADHLVHGSQDSVITGSLN